MFDYRCTNCDGYLEANTVILKISHGILLCSKCLKNGSFAVIVQEQLQPISFCQPVSIIERQDISKKIEKLKNYIAKHYSETWEERKLQLLLWFIQKIL